MTGFPSQWQRTARQATVEFDLPQRTAKPIEREVPDSGGLVVVLAVRPAPGDGEDGGLPKGVRSVSLFVVNRRTPAPDEVQDQAFAFQVELRVKCDVPFVPRPNLCQQRGDWEERVADLQYRDAYEFGVGHSGAQAAAAPETLQYPPECSIRGSVARVL